MSISLTFLNSAFGLDLNKLKFDDIADAVSGLGGLFNAANECKFTCPRGLLHRLHVKQFVKVARPVPDAEMFTLSVCHQEYLMKEIKEIFYRNILFCVRS